MRSTNSFSHSYVRSAVIGASIAAFAGIAPAQSGAKKEAVASNLWESNMAEISLAKLAQKKSCGKDSNQLAKRLESDYTEANQDLAAALNHSVVLSKSLSPLYQEIYDRLSGRSCPLFAGEYTKTVVGMQQEAVRMLNHEASSGANPLKQYAQKAVISVKMDLTAAEDAHKAVIARYGNAAESVPDINQSYPNAHSAAVSPHKSTVSELSNTEIGFINRMGADYLMGIHLGNIAQPRANNEKIKQFARDSVKENRQALHALQTALPKGFHTPAKPSAEQKSAETRLQHLAGGRFDAKYLGDTQGTLSDEIALLKQEVQMGPNPKLKAFASKELPKAQQQLKQVKMLSKEYSAGVN